LFQESKNTKNVVFMQHLLHAIYSCLKRFWNKADHLYFRGREPAPCVNILYGPSGFSLPSLSTKSRQNEAP